MLWSPGRVRCCGGGLAVTLLPSPPAAVLVVLALAPLSDRSSVNLLFFPPTSWSLICDVIFLSSWLGQIAWLIGGIG